DLRDGRHVALHLAADGLTREALDHPETLHDQVGSRHLVAEVVVLLNRVELLAGAVEHEAAGQIAAMRIEEDDVELLDPSLLLHAPEQAHDVVEGLDRRGLASAYGVAPADEEHSVSHAEP